MMYNNGIRLFCDEELKLDKIIELSSVQTHYLSNVMRIFSKKKYNINVFNAKYGEFIAEIYSKPDKRVQNIKILLVCQIHSAINISISNNRKNNAQAKINLIFTAVKP